MVNMTQNMQAVIDRNKKQYKPLDIPAASDRLIETFVKTTCEKYRANAEEWCKLNAPWIDRTGSARELLRGEVVDSNNKVGWEVLHGVEYGIYLETANDGKYAILHPAVLHFQDSFLKDAANYFSGK
jgi:hypothetical protein